MYTNPIISLLDTTTQTIAVSGTPQIVTFNTTNIAQKIILTSTSRFTVNESGYYKVVVNFQVTSSAANKTFDLWFRVSGTDVSNSLSKNIISNSNDQKDIAHITYVNMTAGQYIECWINGDSTGLSILSSAAGVTPTRPAAGSIYMIIEKLP